jgi:hypothetical protein
MIFNVYLCDHILLQSVGGTWGDRGIQVPMSLEDDNIVGTQCYDTLSDTS